LEGSMTKAGQVRAIPASRPRPTHHPEVSPQLGDLRFRTLIGERDWAALPAAVRARFGKSVTGGRTIVYAGEIVECRASLLGRMLAQLCRLVGAPLPLHRDVGVPAVVTVTEDVLARGQYWTRVYGRRNGFPQVIHSSKRFAGVTGLEEYVGRGIGIALRVRVADGALHFLSDHYFLAVGGRRVRLPAWLAPGALTVSHVDQGDGSFAFRLSLDHRLLGMLVDQTALFREQGAVAEGPEVRPLRPERPQRSRRSILG
ncbi:MAG: DUF4166 domain-containing protein, partial [Allosphingosinicella sp.]